MFFLYAEFHTHLRTMDDSVATPVTTNDKQDNDITSRVGDITLEKILPNHVEDQTQVSTSVSIKNDNSKDGILEGEVSIDAL